MIETPGALHGLLVDSGLYEPHGPIVTAAPDTHAARIRALLSGPFDINATIVHVDPLNGLPEAVTTLIQRWGRTTTFS